MPANTSITLKEGTLAIAGSAFSGCSGLTSVTIPNSVTSICNYAFDGCSSLTSVEIPNSVTKIQEYAFSGCSGLVEVYCKATTPPMCTGYGPYFNYEEAKLYVPAGTVAQYQAADYWKNFSNIAEFDEPFTLTANNLEMVYGDALPEFTYTTSGGAFSGTPQFTCEATPASPVGAYPIVISQGTIDNDLGTYVNGTLTITKAPLKITAKDYTIKQGQALPEFEATYEGFKNSETSTVLTKQPIITTTATSASEPGEYEITVSGAEATNYEISYAKGKLTIVNADALIIRAKDYTIEYGDDIPDFEYTSEGATLAGTPAITCEATKTSAVGIYPIVITKGSVTNYNTTFVNGTLTIEKAPLTITAKSYTIKQGETLPTFEAEYSGFKNNETKAVLSTQPTITTTAISTSEPGEYEITVSGAEATNYEISYAKGKLTIDQTRDSEGFKFINDFTYVGDMSDYAGSGSYCYFTNCSQHEDGNVIKANVFCVENFYGVSEGQSYATFPIFADKEATKKIGEFNFCSSFYCVAFYGVYGESGPTFNSTDFYFVKAYNTMEIGETKQFSLWDGTVYTITLLDKIVSNQNSDKKLVFSVDRPLYFGGDNNGSAGIERFSDRVQIKYIGEFFKLIYKVDGEVYKSYNVEYGRTIIPEPAPTKEGYTFSGWSEIPATMPAHDVTVTGSFSINKYKLIYKVDGIEYKSSEVEYGKAITPEAEPTKEGYTFSGWSEIPETMPAKDVTVTGTFAINQYTITYKIDDEVYQTENVDYGSMITPPNAPEREGYTFEWIDVPETMPAHDITIIGSYTSGINTIRMDAENGKVFDLNGRQVKTPGKGVYIINGRKVVIK